MLCECAYYIDVCKMKILFIHHRNQAYMARIKLAVLDHNLHTKRGIARNKNGEQIYSRRYRDVTPCKEAKKYEYLPLLMQDILTSRRESTVGLKNKESVPQDHP